MSVLAKLPIHEARLMRWKAGRAEYRAEDEPFVGDAKMELLEELLDCLNYAEESGRSEHGSEECWPQAAHHRMYDLERIAESVRQEILLRDA